MDRMPTPIPVARAMIMKWNGKKNPTAARALAPMPETQMASTKLYRVWTDMARIMGNESLRMARRGFPMRV